MMRRTGVFVLILTLLATAAASADGGGGYFSGSHVSEFPGLEELTLASSDVGLVYQGGMGYGVNYRGVLSGGFGLFITDNAFPDGLTGGFGGVVGGYRLIKRPIDVTFMSQVGLGGFSTGESRPADEAPGFAALLVEGTISAGLPLGIVMPTAYAGYQVIGRLVPGGLAAGTLIYSPVIGIRVLFGDF
jgi:hypothetical protein